MNRRPIAQTVLIAVTMTLGAVVYLIVMTGSVKTWRNASSSMEPALPKGSRVLAIRSKRANRGDIIVFGSPVYPDVTMIKRVVAIEGDTVEIRAKKLFLNGKSVAEPYVTFEDETVYPKTEQPRDNFGPYRVGPGKLFVLGDNRDNSADSRFYGAIDRRNVKGHPILLFSLKRGVWLP